MWAIRGINCLPIIISKVNTNARHTNEVQRTTVERLLEQIEYQMNDYIIIKLEAGKHISNHCFFNLKDKIKAKENNYIFLTPSNNVWWMNKSTKSRDK